MFGHMFYPKLVSANKRACYYVNLVHALLDTKQLNPFLLRVARKRLCN